MHSAQQGFIEVRLALPGGGKTKFLSGGIYDYRGAQSQIAFKDAILFAAGKIADTQNRYIYDLLPVKVSKTNIGVAGWSNGGNLVMTTMGNYPDELSSIVNWAAFYECPIGPLFYPPNLGGGRNLLINQHYKLGSAATGEPKIDWRKIMFDPTSTRNAGEHHKLGEPEIPGVVFFDENENGHYDEPAEFALTYSLDVGLEKQIYPPEALLALDRKGVFINFREVENDEGFDDALEKNDGKKGNSGAAAGGRGGSGGTRAGKDSSNKAIKPPKKKTKVVDWPSTLAKSDESEQYFQERDGSQFFGVIAGKYPNLLITVLATQVDHMQAQPDHPHIALQYNAWLANKAHWVRLNPDPVYPGAIAQMHSGNFTYNKPNAPIDASTIVDYLETEGTTKDYVLMEATIAELADRVRVKNLKGPLVMPFTKYYNSANPASSEPAGSATPETSGDKSKTTSQNAAANQTPAAGKSSANGNTSTNH
jgi:hypothetical protein